MCTCDGYDMGEYCYSGYGCDSGSYEPGPNSPEGCWYEGQNTSPCGEESGNYPCSTEWQNTVGADYKAPGCTWDFSNTPWSKIALAGLGTLPGALSKLFGGGGDTGEVGTTKSLPYWASQYPKQLNADILSKQQEYIDYWGSRPMYAPGEVEKVNQAQNWVMQGGTPFQQSMYGTAMNTINQGYNSLYDPTFYNQQLGGIEELKQMSPELLGQQMNEDLGQYADVQGGRTGAMAQDIYLKNQAALISQKNQVLQNQAQASEAAKKGYYASVLPQMRGIGEQFDPNQLRPEDLATLRYFLGQEEATRASRMGEYDQLMRWKMGMMNPAYMSQMTTKYQEPTNTMWQLLGAFAPALQTAGNYPLLSDMINRSK